MTVRYSDSVKRLARRRVVRRTIRRARGLAGVGGVGVREPRPRSLRAGPDPHREGRPLGPRRSSRRRRWSAGDVIEQARLEAARPVREGREVHFVAHPSDETILSIDRTRQAQRRGAMAIVTGLSLDVIFPDAARPVWRRRHDPGPARARERPLRRRRRAGVRGRHGQGVMKLVFAGARTSGLRLPRDPAPRVGRRTGDADRRRSSERSGIPMFVKPANLGSSVGISKAEERSELCPRNDAGGRVRSQDRDRSRGPRRARDRMRRARQRRPEASVPGEIIPSREFYDYEVEVPRRRLADPSFPPICPPRSSEEVQRLSIEAFKAIDGAGMSRVDFLLSRTRRHALRQRGQHDPRLHDDQHVREAVGRVRPQAIRRCWIASSRWRSSATAEKQQLRTSVT